MGRKKKYQPETFSAKAGDTKHVRLYRSLLTSEAYKDLSHPARTVYTLLLLQKDEGKYTVQLPYRELKEAYGMNSRTISNAIKSLEDHGFIIIEKGRFISGRHGALYRDATKYTFADAWKSWSKDDSIKNIKTKK